MENVSDIFFCPVVKAEYYLGNEIVFGDLYNYKEKVLEDYKETGLDTVAVRVITAEAYQQILNTLIAIRDAREGASLKDFDATVKETLKTLGEDQ